MKQISIITAGFACLLFSCKKVIKPQPCNCPAPVFKPNTYVPYDSTDVIAVFHIQVIHDSTRTEGYQNNAYINAFFTHYAKSMNTSSSKVMMNDTKLEKAAGQFALNIYGNKDGLDESKLVAPTSWSVSDNNLYGFAYIDSSAFPENTINFPDAIDNYTGYSWSADSITNSDTMLVSISAPRSVDYPMDIYMEYHDSVTHFWTGNTTKNINFGINSLSKFKGQTCIANISLFNHRYVTIYGYKYLFIKQYSFNKSVQIN